MALSVTTDSVRAGSTAAAFHDGGRLLAADAVDNLESGYGGVNADVTDGDTTWQVWVGVNDRALTGECDCAEARPESLCPHAVATALAALDAGTSWATSPGAAADGPPPDPEELRFLALARTLDAERLAELVARHAVRDRLIGTDLEVCAGLLGAAGAEELEPLRDLVDRARAVPGGDPEYELHDVVAAVRAVVAELRVQAVRPATPALLDAAEYAVACWDRLAVLLSRDWLGYRDDIEELGAELADVHLDLCERLRPDPAELAARLAALACPDGDGKPGEKAGSGQAGVGCCLEPPAPYRSLLGPDGLADYRRQVDARWAGGSPLPG